jgi:alpha-tubulin suppressor-like RCC1 family protein
MKGPFVAAACLLLMGCPQLRTGATAAGPFDAAAVTRDNGADSDVAPPTDGGLGTTERHLSAGTSHVCVARGGEVTCAGGIVAGAIGYDPGGRPRAVRVPGEVRALSSAQESACALTLAGDVYCWGERELGLDSDTTRVAEPERATLSGASLLTGAFGHCALSGSAVSCWGSLPLVGSTATADRPERVESFAEVASIAAGSQFYCLGGSDRRVRCRGANSRGQCGAPPSASAPFTEVTGLDDVLAIRAGGASVCALRASGRIACWGSNQLGTLGDGTRDDHIAPVEVRGLGRVSQFDLFGVNACAVTNEGAVWCWGSRQAGLLGDGVRVADETSADFVRATPVRVEAWTDVTEVAVGTFLACALRRDQSVWCWGWNNRLALPWPNGAASRPVRVIPPP